MKEQNRLNACEKIFLSFFYTGMSPWAPGTMGSLATLPLLYLFGYFQYSLFFLLALIIVLTVIAIIVTDKVQRRTMTFDPSWIVIDEVLGMMLTWLFLPSHQLNDLFLVFISFRFFDIFKIWPATFFDKKIKSGAGTILDDLISALYAGLLCVLIKKFF